MEALVLDAEWDPREADAVGEGERRATDASRAWRAPELRIAERERPDPAPDEVLVRVRYAGVCGSDVAMIETGGEGYVHYSAYLGLPTTLGHEFAGEVVEVGSEVTRVSPGDPVTAEVTDYCGTCDACRQGFTGHCEDFEQLGFTIPGAFAEYVAVPAKLCYDVSALGAAYAGDDLFRAAATVEPSTITYHGCFVRADGIRPGDYYVFHGAGPIGLTGMNVARAAGAGRVIGVEPSQERRAVARELGFEHLIDPGGDDSVARIDALTEGRGADVHVEVAGAVGQTYPLIAETLAEDANVVHISNAGAAAPLDTRAYQARGAQVYGAEGHTGGGVYPRVVRLMAAGRLDNLPMVTSTFSLEEADAAVERAAERVDGKVLIEC